MKENVHTTPTLAEWLSTTLPKGGLVGVDPFLITSDSYSNLEKSLKKTGHTVVTPTENLVDIVWGAEKPKQPCGAVFVLPLQYTGKSWQDKVSEVRKEMKEKNVSLLVLSALDEIAWLLNLRGSDIPCTPVFFAYAVVSNTFLTLFVNEAKVTPEVKQHLTTPGNGLNVEILPYTSFLDHFDKYVEQKTDGKIWLPGNCCSYALASRVAEDRRFDKFSPIGLMKAIKNPVEMKGMKNAHVKDAVAHCEFLLWLENEIKSGKTVTEIDASDKFEKLRQQQVDYFSLSFDTISGAGSNGAINHYKSSPETNAQITKDQLYLVDSGGQYKDGTTDVTRTVCFNEPSQYQKECFTKVLQGHMAMAMLKLPEGVSGYRLDSISRMALWDVGLEFRHGTGHGVGHFLGVHEGPAGFSYRPSSYMEGIKEGMIITIEPGYYEVGKFGIRIENVYALIQAETKYKYQDMKFLTFEPLTLVPILTKMVDSSLLSKKEIEWLNNYHKKCVEVLTPELEKQGKKDVLAWLNCQCQPLC